MQLSAATKQPSSRNDAPSGPTLAAGQTFRSIFGGPLALQETLKMRVKTTGDGASEASSGARVAAQADDSDDLDEDMAAWDDPFSTDGGGSAADDDGENNNSSAVRFSAATVPVPQLQHAHSEDTRVPIEMWADNDDDEDNWKEALQARVDQLELVVPPVGGHRSPAAGVRGDAESPIDQRATLTLLGPPQPQLTRSASLPATAEATQTHSRSKIPRYTHRINTNTSLTSQMHRYPARAVGTDTSSEQASAAASSTITQARKRSNSRDFTAARASNESRRPAKSLQFRSDRSPDRSGSSSQGLVRAVVARGNTGGSTSTGSAPRHRIQQKRSGASVATVSDAELVRRFVLDDVKQMSVERIVAEARRLQFLEAYFQRNEGSPAPHKTDNSAVTDDARTR
ncbi:hypothetical protein PINS_up006783 [Pythium insidiosum]|nr:hypothetical protein PINS_up006783 [Pythium insidiosum]